MSRIPSVIDTEPLHIADFQLAIILPQKAAPTFPVYLRWITLTLDGVIHYGYGHAMKMDRSPISLDSRIRLAAFDWLAEQVRIFDDVLPRALLAQGFTFRGERIPLVSPQGIFTPKQLEYPLTITTTAEGPYDDSFDRNDLLLYKYRGSDPNHRDNMGLRMAMEKEIPLIYFHGIVPGKYLAVWPVYIVGDDRASLTFKVAADNQITIERPENVVYDDGTARRAYITATVRARLHQKGFRERVIAAYRSQCAFCRLRHVELLDAAHIIPDGEENSRPTVNNGLALCKIHHAAFDHNIMGVTPNYELKVREDVLREIDGPMLLHGLQELHNHKLILPGSEALRPNREYLDWRYERFRKAM